MTTTTSETPKKAKTPTTDEVWTMIRAVLAGMDKAVIMAEEALQAASQEHFQQPQRYAAETLILRALLDTRMTAKHEFRALARSLGKEL